MQVQDTRQVVSAGSLESKTRMPAKLFERHGGAEDELLETAEKWELFAPPGDDQDAYSHSASQPSTTLKYPSPSKTGSRPLRPHTSYQQGREFYRPRSRPHTTMSGSMAFGTLSRRRFNTPSFQCYAPHCGNPDHQNQYPRPETRGLVSDMERQALVRSPVQPPTGVDRSARAWMILSASGEAYKDRLTPGEKFALGKQKKGSKRRPVQGQRKQDDGPFYGSMSFSVPSKYEPLSPNRIADTTRLERLRTKSRESAIIKGAITKSDINNGFRALRKNQPPLKATTFRVDSDLHVPPATTVLRRKKVQSSALSDTRMGLTANTLDGMSGAGADVSRAMRAQAQMEAEEDSFGMMQAELQNIMAGRDTFASPSSQQPNLSAGGETALGLVGRPAKRFDESSPEKQMGLMHSPIPLTNSLKQQLQKRVI